MSAELKLADSETGVIERTLEIAKKRRNTLVRLKTAIRQRDLDEADRLVTELVPDEKSHRAYSRFDRIPSR